VRLVELKPKWLKRIDDKTHQWDDVPFAEADGIIFLCPKCIVANGGSVGTHSVICWRPHVPQTTTPVPGRWEFQGTGFDDLTLVAASSSILLKGACLEPNKAWGPGWHGFIRNGQIE